MAVAQPEGATQAPPAPALLVPPCPCCSPMLHTGSFIRLLDRTGASWGRVGILGRVPRLCIPRAWHTADTGSPCAGLANQCVANAALLPDARSPPWLGNGKSHPFSQPPSWESLPGLQAVAGAGLAPGPMTSVQCPPPLPATVVAAGRRTSSSVRCHSLQDVTSETAGTAPFAPCSQPAPGSARRAG